MWITTMGTGSTAGDTCPHCGFAWGNCSRDTMTVTVGHNYWRESERKDIAEPHWHLITANVRLWRTALATFSLPIVRYWPEALARPDDHAAMPRKSPGANRG